MQGPTNQGQDRHLTMRPATNRAPRVLRAFFHRLSQHRAIRVTTEGTLFLLLTLAVGIAAVNTGNNLFYLLLAMMLSLIVLSGLLSEQCVRRLDFHRHLPDSLFVNQPAVATLWIANHKAHVPTVSVRILEVVAGQDHDRGIHLTHLAPGASTLRSYPLLARRRGRYYIEGIRVITPFPFGLFQKKPSIPAKLPCWCVPPSSRSRRYAFRSCTRSATNRHWRDVGPAHPSTTSENFAPATIPAPSTGSPLPGRPS